MSKTKKTKYVAMIEWDADSYTVVSQGVHTSIALCIKDIKEYAINDGGHGYTFYIAALSEPISAERAVTLSLPDGREVE